MIKQDVKHELGNVHVASLRDTLLDSSLILTTNSLELYKLKIIICNDYIQVYELNEFKSHKVKDIENKTINNIKNIDTDNLKKQNSTDTIDTLAIEKKNIVRSKLQCQRLAKCNANEWKTFITLTFAENITDIKIANKKFRYFVDKVQRKFKEFKYICIPEFQKRGAVHYHLLTNISIENENLIISQADNKKFKHIKYWNDGFTKVDNLSNDIKKIVGYISKYMTKDIDNRLYNRHRYFYSRNLNKPIINYLDLNNNKHEEYFNKLLKDKKIIYENEYENKYTNEKIIFKEFL